MHSHGFFGLAICDENTTILSFDLFAIDFSIDHIVSYRIRTVITLELQSRFKQDRIMVAVMRLNKISICSVASEIFAVMNKFYSNQIISYSS